MAKPRPWRFQREDMMVGEICGRIYRDQNGNKCVCMQVSSVLVREHRSTTNLIARWTVCYRNQGSLQEEVDTMTLLIPDRDRENREDFIWCVPIERQKWNKWYKLSEQFKTVTPKEHGGVRYMNRMEGRSVKTILVMPNAQQSDDDAVTACAYLRMIKGMTCRMYVVRCTDDPLTGARLIERAAGADVTLVEDMELEGEEDGTAKEAGG